MAADDTEFSADDQVRVSGQRSKTMTPLPVEVGIYGLKSILAPKK